MDIIEFRAIIETECAGLAAERADEKDIEELQAIWDSMNECKIRLDSKNQSDFTGCPGTRNENNYW